MSILTRPLTDDELAAAGIEPAPIADETFTQVFAVDQGDLEIVDETDGTEPLDDNPPAPKRIGPVVWAWAITTGVAFGAITYGAVVTS